MAISIVDFDEWSVYDGASEGSGRSEKVWIQSPNGEIGLFKYPKCAPNTNEITTEHISEHIAHHLGKLIGIETASVDIGKYKGRVGCMSYLINNPDEAIIEGAILILGKHPDYDLDEMRELSTGRYYCLEHLLEVSQSLLVTEKWIQMMMFDYLIGNSDRHQNNWAVLVSYADGNKNRLMGRVCPLYDNGSSLCCYVNENIEDYLRPNSNRFEALVNTKSRSMIRINGYEKKRPTHLEVIETLLSRYPYAKSFGDTITSNISRETVNILIDSYDNVLSYEKIELIKKYLLRKIELLQDALKRVKK